MKRWLLLLLFVISLDALAATNVRGRVDVAVGEGVLPMAGATVSMCAVGQACTDYVTGPDGMYYFTVAAGDHLIKINGAEKLRVAVPDQETFDVDPLVVR